MAATTPGSQEPSGREILLHMGALEQVARISPEHAGMVMGAIGRIGLLKAVHHGMVAESARVFNLLPEEAAETIFASFRHRFRFFEQQPRREMDPITIFFQEIRWAEADADHEPRQAIVGGDEWVYDTCGHGPWLNLSTDQFSAKRMFDDKRTPNELLAEMQKGAPLEYITMIGRDATLQYRNSDGIDLDPGNEASIPEETLRSADTQALLPLALEAIDCLHTTVKEINGPSVPLAVDITVAAMSRFVSQQLAKPAVLLP